MSKIKINFIRILESIVLGAMADGINQYFGFSEMVKDMIENIFNILVETTWIDWLIISLSGLIGIILLEIYGCNKILFKWLDKLNNTKIKSIIDEEEPKNITDNLEFIPLKVAIFKFAEETACYNSFKNIWERELGLSQEEYYKNCLLGENENRNLPFYGYEKFSSVKELQEILTSYISTDAIRSPDYDIVYSKLNEELYNNVSVKLNDLTTIIKSGRYSKPLINKRY